MADESDRLPLRPQGVSLSDARVRELRRQCAQLLRRAVLTLAALPDPERRYLTTNLPSSLPAPLGDPNLAYAYHAPRAARFQPTPADVSRLLDVLAWLTWLELENDGDREVKIIVARAFGVPVWRLAQRFARSEGTIRRWEAGAVAAIANRFWREIADLGPAT